MGFKIERGARPKPVKAVLYGVEGVGKTTFAAMWPGAVFIDVEDGSGHYDVARLPRPDSWLKLLEEIEAAARMGEVGTLVIDTVDAAEALCIRRVLEKHKAVGIESVGGGYGKGYTYLAEEFGKLFAALDKVVDAGKNVLVVAHAQIKRFAAPDEAGEYDRWELKLQKKDDPIVKEWCDLLLFANYKNDVIVSDDGKKMKASGGKKRAMYATHSAAYDAKNRLGLPDSMKFDFAEIADKVPSFAGGGVVEGPTIAVPDDEAEAQAGAEAAAKAKAATPDAPPLKFEEVTPPEIQQLHQLMADYRVNDAQLRDAVGSMKNNSYTDETPIADYSMKFVGNLLKHWERIVELVNERGDVYGDDIPF